MWKKNLNKSWLQPNPLLWFFFFLCKLYFNSRLVAWSKQTTVATLSSYLSIAVEKHADVELSGITRCFNASKLKLFLIKGTIKNTGVPASLKAHSTDGKESCLSTLSPSCFICDLIQWGKQRGVLLLSGNNKLPRPENFNYFMTRKHCVSIYLDFKASTMLNIFWSHYRKLCSSLILMEFFWCPLG